MTIVRPRTHPPPVDRAPAVGRFGSQTFEAPAGGAEPDPVDFTTIDAGFNVGLGYSF